MQADGLTPEEAAHLAAVTSLCALPADDIDMWILVVLRPSGLFQVTSTACCDGHTAAFLATTASDLISTQTAEQHARLS